MSDDNQNLNTQQNFQSFCNKCLIIEEELITALKNTEEFKKSLAISEAIKYLLSKIKTLEQEKYEILEINHKLEQRLFSKEQELEHEKKRLIMEIEGLDSLKSLFKEKNESLQKLNQVNKQMLIDREMKSTEEANKLKSKIEEFEKDVELKNKIINSLKEKLTTYLEKEENTNNIFEKNEVEYNQKISFIEKEKFQLLQESIIKENNYKKMIKDLEVLIYKINLENFDLKERLDKMVRSTENIEYYGRFHTISNDKFIQNKRDGNFQNNISYKSCENFDNFQYKIDRNLKIDSSIDIDKEIENIENYSNKKSN